MYFDTIFDYLTIQYKAMNSNTSKTESVNIGGEILSFALYKLPSQFTFDSQATVNTIFSLCNSDDCATQVLLGVDITVATGVKLTPPKRCKGFIIYTTNIFTNNGTVSMTSRGCVAKGQNLYLYDDLIDGMQYIPARGAAGGDSYSIPANGWFYNGRNGKNGSNRQTGGGGSGASRNWWRFVQVGRGGYGTSYSGGSGSGAVQSDGSNGWNAYSANAPDNGGKGTNGVVCSSNASGYAQICMSGQGNPINTYAPYYRAGPSVTPYTNIGGTGGLLVCYCNIFTNNGLIESNGGNTMYTYSWTSNICIASGGASGGGSVNIFSGTIIKQGKITATGGRIFKYVGAEGGLGGDGCVTINQYMYLFSSSRKNSNIYRNVSADNSFNFEKLFI